MLDVLRNKLGADTDAVFGDDQRKKTSPFGTGVKWKAALNKTATQRGQYVTQQLTTAPV